MRDKHQHVRWNSLVFRIAAHNVAPGHWITGLEVGHSLADGLYDARGLLSIYKWELGLVPAFAIVDVDKVDARGMHPHQRFARFGRGKRDIGHGKNFRAADLSNLDRFH